MQRRLTPAPISAHAGKNFNIDPRVTGNMNIISQSPVSKDLAYQILLSALRMQGFAVIEERGGDVSTSALDCTKRCGLLAYAGRIIFSGFGSLSLDVCQLGYALCCLCNWVGLFWFVENISTICQLTGAITMNHRFKKTLFIALVSTLALAGCDKPGLQQQARDAIERALAAGIRGQVSCGFDEMSGGLISNCGLSVRRGAFIKPPDIKIDIRDIQISLQASGASVSVTSGQATLNLESNGSRVGTAAFAYSKVGDDILFDQPEQVNDWINSFNVEIDAFDLTLSSIAIVVPEATVGTIVVTQSILTREIARQGFNFSGGGGGRIEITTQAP